MKNDNIRYWIDNITMSDETMRVGGCAYNVASILQQAGAEPLLVTPVGLDGVYGPFALKAIEEMGFRGPVKLKGKENTPYALNSAFYHNLQNTNDDKEAHCGIDLVFEADGTEYTVKRREK